MICFTIISYQNVSSFCWQDGENMVFLILVLEHFKSVLKIYKYYS